MDGKTSRLECLFMAVAWDDEVILFLKSSVGAAQLPVKYQLTEVVIWGLP